MAESEGRPARTLEDLHRAARVISRHFDTDTVVVIGSQAILLKRPDSPASIRTSAEIDAYPSNAKEWESSNGLEASEEINAFFGSGSDFHKTHGFYIDGVDENTAKLPPDWRTRAVEKIIRDEQRQCDIRIVVPDDDDLVVAKLNRLAEKDKDFIRELARCQQLKVNRIRRLLDTTEPAPERLRIVNQFLDSLYPKK